MLRFVLIRLLRAALTVLLVVTFAFAILRLSGDPALSILGDDASPEALAAFRHAWGLDDPLWAQYLNYIGACFRADFGQSMRSGEPALGLVLSRVPATLALTLPALALKLGIGLPLGVLAALHRGSTTDRVVMGGAIAW